MSELKRIEQEIKACKDAEDNCILDAKKAINGHFSIEMAMKIAIKYGQLEVVQYLIDNGVDVNLMINNITISRFSMNCDEIEIGLYLASMGGRLL